MRLAPFIAAVSLLFAAPALARLPEGAKAPDFTIQAALAGKDFRFSLADALEKGPVVLYFYPKSFTSVCTEEAHEFAEAAPEFDSMSASVIGVSADTIETQRKFSSSECRDKFPVGADPEFKVIKAYDATWGPNAMPGFADRISYVISPEGKVLSSVKDSGATAHIRNALAVVKAWRAARN